jgi:arsenite methyltransferase
MPRARPSPAPDYGIDGPGYLRNVLLIGGLCLAVGLVTPRDLHALHVGIRLTLLITGGILIGEGLLFLLYIKVGKLRHRDVMLALHAWRGDEQVLDVGCGRGLLLAGAAKHLTTGHATGIDIWSNDDMARNSSDATLRNLALEGVADRCTLVSVGAQDMTFPDGSFDVILSNLCLHNIYDAPTRRRALEQIIRVLEPGGLVLLSDYKLTGEYARQLRQAGLEVNRNWRNALATFPPLAIVVARKPPA